MPSDSWNTHYPRNGPSLDRVRPGSFRGIAGETTTGGDIMRELVRSTTYVGVIAILGLAAVAGTAAAYGKADHPLAQIEFSGNCDNASFPFCAPPPNGVGTGGIWLWIEVDANGTGDVRGAVCNHTVGGAGGPGGAGAIPIKGNVSWTYSNLKNGIDAGAEFLGMVDPGDRYYMVTIPGGDKILFPTTVNHYSSQPTSGVSLQVQVAP